MGAAEELSPQPGTVWGRWEVVRRVATASDGSRRVLCQCVCGREQILRREALEAEHAGCGEQRCREVGILVSPMVEKLGTHGARELARKLYEAGVDVRRIVRRVARRFRLRLARGGGR